MSETTIGSIEKGKAMKATLGITILAALALLAVPGTSAASSGSCGTVTGYEQAQWRLTAKKGSPSCATVRAIAKEYGHPKAVRYSCSPHAHLCMYGVYADGWRCTGLFQGNFSCWLGGNAEGKNARQSFWGASVY